MKFKVIYSLLFCAPFLFSGCSSNQSKSTMNSISNAAMAPVQEQVKANEIKSDAAILGTLIVLNRNEIAAAKDAKRKASNEKVKNYASYMFREHRANLQETQHLGSQLNIQPNKTNQTAATLAKNGARQLAQLNHVNKAAFDRTYIAAMVKDHSEALNLVDSLYNQTTNGQLRNQLKMTRAHIAAHLQMAQTIQNEIG